jgi:hypothetical protein
VTRQGLHSQGIIFHFPTKARSFFLLNIETSSGALPVSLRNGYQEQTCQNMKLSIQPHLLLGQQQQVELYPYSPIRFHDMHMVKITFLPYFIPFTIPLPYSPFLHLTSPSILVSDLLQVHTFPLGYSTPITLLSTPVPLPPSEFH